MKSLLLHSSPVTARSLDHFFSPVSKDSMDGGPGRKKHSTPNVRGEKLVFRASTLGAGEALETAGERAERDVGKSLRLAEGLGIECSVFMRDRLTLGMDRQPSCSRGERTFLTEPEPQVRASRE